MATAGEDWLDPARPIDDRKSGDRETHDGPHKEGGDVTLRFEISTILKREITEEHTKSECSREEIYNTHTNRFFVGKTKRNERRNT